MTILAGDSLLLVETHFGTDHEGWPRGDPEIMVGIIEFDSLAQSFRITRQCAGDGQGAPFGFDINDEVWSGRGLVGYRSLLPTRPISALPQRILAIWEDDSGEKCNYHGEARFESLDYSVERLHLAGLFQIVGREDSGSVWKLGLSALMVPVYYLFSTADDDLFGIVTLPSSGNPFQEPRDVKRANPEFGGALLTEGWVRFEVH